jgi:hypothetical protein
VKRVDERLSLTYPGAAFVNATEDYNELKEAIEKLEWHSLALVMDKYLCIQMVCCPWGRGTFLHTCNKMPLEDFLANYANFAFNCYYNSGKRKTWVNCIRPDCPEKVLILMRKF